MQNTVTSESEIALQNFTESIKAKDTRKKYLYALDTYIDYLGLEGKRQELSLLLKKNTKDIENNLISYILKLRKEDYSFSTILTRVAGIINFFIMNDIVLNKKKIYRYMGEHVKTVKDRAYTIEEIKKILDCCNLKYKVIVSMMASTGCRIGAISALKEKGLKYIKKEEILSKKGFITKEDQKSIEDSVMDSIKKESDPNLWKTLMFTKSKMTTK